MTTFILVCSVHQNLDGIGEENEPMDTEVHNIMLQQCLFVSVMYM